MDTDDNKPEFEVFQTISRAIQDKFEVIKTHLPDHPTTVTLDLPSLGHRRVGFYGSRGAGKTTLVNRLIGSELLSTGTESAITASLTHVIPWQNLTYAVTVYWLPADEWDEVFREAKTNLDELRKLPPEDRPAGPHPYESFASQLSSLWGCDHPFSEVSNHLTTAWEDEISSTNLIPPSIFESWSTGSFTASFNNLEEARNHLITYTHADEGWYWPLVAKVHVFGPFVHLLAGGFAVVDIPGNLEGNLALNRRYDQGLLECDCLFYVPKVERLISQITVTEIVDHPRHVSQFGIVVTHQSALRKAPNSEKLKQYLKRLFPGNNEDIDAANVFFFENDRHYNVGDQDLEEFIAQFHRDDAKEVGYRIAQIIDDCNLRLDIIRHIVEGNKAPIDYARQLFQDVLAASPNRLCAALAVELPKTPVSFSLISDHYSALQTHLRADHFAYNRHFIKHTLAHVLPSLDSIVKNELHRLCEEAKVCLEEYQGSLVIASAIQAFSSLRDSLQLVNFASALSLHLVANVNVITWTSYYRQGKGCSNEMRALLEDAWADHSVLFTRQIAQLTMRFATNFVSRHFSRVSKLFNELESAGLLNHELPNLLDPITRLSAPAAISDSLMPMQSHHASLMEDLERLVQSNPQLSPLSPIHYRYRDKRGFLYILANQSMDCLVRLGEVGGTATRRAKQLHDSGVPNSFNIEKEFETVYARRFQDCMTEIFKQVRCARNPELFNAPVSLVIEVGAIVQQLLEIPS